jgi:hypothetical protein
MAKRIATLIREVVQGIRQQEAAKYADLDRAGRGLKNEGYVGGYLQALSDVLASQKGIPDGNSRFCRLWERAASRQGEGK